ncbi:MAG: tRNA guanosine(34) transglycosylase Tgt [Nanoarchaeota archaeon]
MAPDKDLFFQITAQDKHSQARCGLITTAHGSIPTPAFIPVATQATIKGITSAQLEEIGVEAVLGNTYHLYLRPGEKTVKKLGGLHQFMHWNKPLFTDSGGFQIFSLNKGMQKGMLDKNKRALDKSICTINDDGVEFKSHIDQSRHVLTPEKSIQIQRDLGADIIFTFDECLDFNADYETTKKAMQRTHHWAERCWREFSRLNHNRSQQRSTQSKQALYGIVQGGKYKDLRGESSRFIAGLPFPGIGIGSIFGEPKEKSLEVMKWMMDVLPPEKPKHLLGIGSVDDIFNYVQLGIDTFDCVLPTRLARVGYIFLRPESGGTRENKFRYRILNVQFKDDKKPLDPACKCYVCQNFSRAYLRHLFKAGELLAYTLATYHNLWFFQRMMEEIRGSIEGGRFKELKGKWN